MALKISLKPNERMILGGAVIKNGSKAADIYVENKVPILREKDIVGEKDATTPCRRLYLVIQLMYIDEGNLAKFHGSFLELIQAIAGAAPSMTGALEKISQCVADGKLYQALKLTRELFEYEEELIKHAG